MKSIFAHSAQSFGGFQDMPIRRFANSFHLVRGVKSIFAAWRRQWRTVSAASNSIVNHADASRQVSCAKISLPCAPGIEPNSL
jgi:hypothetical protein